MMMVIRVSLRVMVTRVVRVSRSREGREGEEEPTRRRSQGGITREMLTAGQRH